MRHVIIISGMVCLAFMLLPTCAPQPEQQAEPVAEEAPSTGADMAAVEKVADDFVAAWNAGDVEAMLALCHEDEVVMPPNEPAHVIKEDGDAWLRNIHDTYVSEITLTSMKTEIAHDWAFATCTYSISLTPKAGGEPATDTQKGLWILKRQSNGDWKYTHAIWNSDNPPPVEPTT
jgi:ketosteroid isomerase-like protein